MVIIVSEKDIIVQGKRIALVSSVLNTDGIEITPLKNELNRLTKQKRQVVTADGKPVARKVTIMGDKKIPYKLLKKIMITCAGTKYANISLAVVQENVAQPSVGKN